MGELIDQVEDDKLTADLLEVNDEKNKSQSQAKQGAIKKSPASAQSPAARPNVTEAPLIDFSTPQTLGATSEPASLAPSLANFKDDDAANLANWIGEENVEKPETTQEFDQFLAERAAAGETPKKDS